MPFPKRPGFTLVELLVVVSIIAVLISLLLPAVQAAREAGRRCQCANQMKQIGLAMQTYHDTHNSFPVGARYGLQTPNWRVALFPFLEQRVLYDSLNLNTGFQAKGYSTATYGYSYGPNTMLEKLALPGWNCPSSISGRFPGSDSCRSQHSDWDNGQLVDYAGIAGAYPDPANRASVCAGGENQGNGYHCENGIIFLVGACTMANVTDGTSNTMIVAEQSGRVGATDIRACYHAAWAGMGSGSGNVRPSQQVAGGHYFGGGLTTVRYPINSGAATCHSTSGCNVAWDANTVLNSMHPGGIQSVFVDGSVHFIAETVSLTDVLFRLATKDDGQVVQYASP